MALPTADPRSLVGATLDGKYALDAYVARGGFGHVYRARHLRLHRVVAVKVLRLDVAPGDVAVDVRAQFEAEARLVAQLEHPAIVRVLDFGVSPVGDEPDVPWMVTEWVDGATLAQDTAAREGHGGRSPEACLALLKPVFDALVYAHGLGIAHRDIKPANLMFTSATEADARASVRAQTPPLKLLDFGIAKVMAPGERTSATETVTRSTLVSFSARYGAPEQFGGGRTGPWTDIHAMALVLTEMLIGRRPYEGNDVSDLHYEAMNARRPTPGRHGVDVGAWEAILAKALALRPTDRYRSMESFLDALESADLTRVRPAVSTEDSAPAVELVPAPPDAAPLAATVVPAAALETPRRALTPSRIALAVGIPLAAACAALALWSSDRPFAGAPPTRAERSLRTPAHALPTLRPLPRISPPVPLAVTSPDVLVVSAEDVPAAADARTDVTSVRHDHGRRDARGRRSRLPPIPVQ